MTPVVRLVALAVLVCACILNAAPVSANVPHAVRSADGSFAVLFGSAGGEGSIKVFKNASADANGDSKYKRTFEVRFSRIEETNSNGGKVQSASNFASDASMWQGPTTTVVQGVNTQLVSITNNALQINNQASSASLTISAYIYSASGSVVQGNETLSVPKNALKMTFGISNWPFASTNNTLTFGLELMLDSRSSKDGQGQQSNIDGGRQRRMAWGGAAMDVAANALVDGVLTPIRTSLTFNGAKTFIAFSFPSFNSSVVYDPTVSIDDSTAAATAAASISGMVIVMMIAALAAMHM